MARSAWKVGSLALLASVVGSGLLLRAWALQPQREAEQRGLRVRLERAVWLHEATDHGATAALPRLPGAPPAEARRLTVELSLFNPQARALEFSARELRLVASEPGAGWSPSAGAPSRHTLRPRERLLLRVDFDVPRTRAPLRLEWARGTERVALLATRRPPSPGAEPAGWPERVEDLPEGSVERGAALFHGRLACTSCHGDPNTAEAPSLGPALGTFARVASTRIEDLGAAQYAYESLLNPNGFISPECAHQRPCARPSAMPLYGEVLTAREMADVIRYLLSLGNLPGSQP